MDKSRQQFEEYCRVNELPLEVFNGNYNWNITRIAWEAWQASRESLEIELPLKADDKDPFYDDFDAGLNTGIEKCKELLTSNGVKVK